MGSLSDVACCWRGGCGLSWGAAQGCWLAGAAGAFQAAAALTGVGNGWPHECQMPGAAAGLAGSVFCCSLGPEASGRGGSPLSLNLGAGGKKAACILSPSPCESACQPGARPGALPAAVLPPAGILPVGGAAHPCCCGAGWPSAGVASQCTPSLRRMTHLCQPSSALATSRSLAPGSSRRVSAGNQARRCDSPCGGKPAPGAVQS